MVKPGIRRGWILSGDDPAAHKQIQSAVPINIAEGDGSNAPLGFRRNFRELASQRIQLNDIRSLARGLFVVSGPDQDFNFFTGASGYQNARLISGYDPVSGWNFKSNEPSLAIILKHTEPATFSAANNQIIPSIAIEIGPCNSGAKLA